jgi:hypothetical protein
MKKIIILLLVITGCQTAKIKNREYKVSQATIELGSIGSAKSMYNLDNDFSIHALPVLENKIRLDIQVQPFNEDIYKTYTDKAVNDQTLMKIEYNDSLPVKPEYVTVNIMDLTAMASELNGPHNKDIATYLKNTKKAVTVTGVAIVFSSEVLDKIKQADTYYLLNSQDKKYTVALYKEGKKTDVIDLDEGVELAYTLGKFCWSLSDRQQWYIGEIVKDNKGCKGKTREKIKDKEEKNLFKL